MNLTDIKRQRGAALVTSLVIVLVISILGVGIARQVIAQRKVSSSHYDQTVTFVDAESGLAEGEAVIADNAANPSLLLPSAATPLVVTQFTVDTWWQNPDQWASAAVATNAGVALHGSPSYLIEDGGLEDEHDLSKKSASRRHYFRVTARVARAQGATSFVQSYYAIME